MGGKLDTISFSGKDATSSVVVGSHSVTAAGLILPVFETNNLATGERQTLTLRSVVDNGFEEVPAGRGSIIKDAASDDNVRVTATALVTWVEPGNQLLLYVASSSSSDSSLDGVVKFIDAGNPTGAVDSNLITINENVPSGYNLLSMITDYTNRELDVRNVTDSLPSAYDAAKTAASQSSVDGLPTATQVAAAVWTATTRTLTGFGSLVAAIKAALFDAGSTANKLAVDGDGKVGANNMRGTENGIVLGETYTWDNAEGQTRDVTISERTP